MSGVTLTEARDLYLHDLLLHQAANWLMTSLHKQAPISNNVDGVCMLKIAISLICIQSFVTRTYERVNT